MCRGIPRGCHLAFKLEGRRLNPVNIGFNGFAGSSLIEPVTQGSEGLPGEFFRALGFADPELQLGTGFRWEHRAGLLVDGTAASTTESKNQHQQAQAAAAPQRPAIGGLTRLVRWN